MTGVRQLITGHTRFHAGSKPSLLDHIYTNEPSRVEVENISYGTSDHNLVSVRRKSGATVERPRIIVKRVFKNFKLQDFIEDVANTDWDELMHIESLDDCVQQFEEKFVKIS